MLKRLNHFLFRNFGRHFRYRPQSCLCKTGDCISLSELSSGKEAQITCNNDIKTIERGLYQGKKVSTFRNEPGEPNLVVAVGDSRYVMDRRLARLIMVRIL